MSESKVQMVPIDTFINAGERSRLPDHYADAPAGFLAAYTPENIHLPASADLLGEFDGTIPAVKKVFTMPFESLFEVWSAVARTRQRKERR
jgi:hypothetical protein